MFLACRHPPTPAGGQCGQGCDDSAQCSAWRLPDNNTNRGQKAAWHDIPSSGEDILCCNAVEALGFCKVGALEFLQACRL